MTLAQFVSRWVPDFRRSKPKNLLMSNPTYAALTRQIEKARGKHARLRPLERRRTKLLHDALARCRS